MKLATFRAPFSVLLATSVFGALLFGAGLVIALAGPWGEPLVPVVRKPNGATRSGAIQLVVLGDSITRGTGDAEGGYASRLTDKLKTSGRIAALSNFAVDGSETKDVLAVLEKTAVRRAIEGATVLILSAGGNDLSHALRESTTDRESAEALPAAARNLESILKAISAMNPALEVRVLGLYNPFEVVPGEERRPRRILFEWNTALEQVTLEQPKVLFVPIADLFEQRPDRLANDRYHPGPAGHEAITERLLATFPERDPP